MPPKEKNRHRRLQEEKREHESSRQSVDASSRPCCRQAAPGRFLGIDVGAETIKLIELVRDQDGVTLAQVRRRIVEHHKKPEMVLRELLAEWDWATVTGAAVCGRFSQSSRRHESTMS